MAQNDYFVIVYRVLKYLYDCLKAGNQPEIAYLTASTYNIPDSYWTYIVISLISEGYIKGIAMTPTKNGVVFGDLQDAIITPKGIEYLFENSLLEKAKKTLKEAKEMIPFI
jgi:hypothetical protein|uniref:YjcQ protein n=1 Tax=Myoviridae sp. ctumZ20 TaxID=2825201 RepID=A0A8S5U155_9CAUD|nr:MAG TPA: YjcQ protein [Myoviridae sp. ctumZ20]